MYSRMKDCITLSAFIKIRSQKIHKPEVLSRSRFAAVPSDFGLYQVTSNLVGGRIYVDKHHVVVLSKLL